MTAQHRWGVQALGQAVESGAPYAVLLDGVDVIFLRIRPRWRNNKVYGWEVSYCAKNVLSEAPSPYQILNRLMQEEPEGAPAWPTPAQMFLEDHSECPVSIEFVKALKASREAKEEGGRPQVARATEANLGEPIRPCFWPIGWHSLGIGACMYSGFLIG